MANLIIGNGEDLRALVDSLFTLRDPEKEAALSEEEREALRPETGRGDPGFFEVALGMGGNP